MFIFALISGFTRRIMMKRISAIIAAALITLTVSLPVFAEPSGGEEETSAVSTEEKSDSSESDEKSSDEKSDASKSDEKSSDEKSDASKSDEKSSDEKSDAGKSDEKSSDEKSDSSASEEKSGAEESSELDISKIKFNEYKIDEGDLTISVPEELYVLTRDLDEEASVLKERNYTKEQVTENFQEHDTYLNASAKDFSYDITVTVVENDDTKTLDSLSKLNDDELQSITDNLLSSKVYKGCSRTWYNNTLFLTLDLEFESSGMTIYGIQEYTIINGKRVNITFQSYTGELSSDQKKVFNAIMDSVVFEGVEPSAAEESLTEQSLSIDSIDIRYIYIVAASVVGLISLLIMIVVGSKYKKSKKLLEEESAEDEEEIEIDFSDIRKYKKNNSPDTDIQKNDGEMQDIYSGAEPENTPAPKKMTYEDVVAGTVPALGEHKDDSTDVREFIEENVNVTELPEMNENTEGYSYGNEYQAPVEEPDGFKEIQAVPVGDEQYSSSEYNYGGYSQADDTYNESGSAESSAYGGYSQNEQTYGGYNAYPQQETEFAGETYDDGEDDEVVFAEITEQRHTEIEQIGGDSEEVETTEAISQSVADEPVKEEPEELSEYEKRFGKNRITPPTTVSSASASPDITIVNTDEKRASKFEKHFGKLTPAAQPVPAADNIGGKTAETLKAIDEITDTEETKPVAEAPALEEKTEKTENAPSNKLFSRLIEKLKNNNPEEDDEEETNHLEETASEKTEDLDKAVKSPEAEQLSFDDNDESDEYYHVEGQLTFEDTSEENVISDTAPVGDNSIYENNSSEYIQQENVTTENIDDNVIDRDIAPEYIPHESAAEPVVDNTIFTGSTSDNITKENVADEIDSSSVIYKNPESEKTAEAKPNGEIELEISKSADGSLVIGALNEGSGKPINVEIRDASNFKEERAKEMAALGFETAGDNEIYNARKVENEENPFVVKPKAASVESTDEGDGTSRFDKLFGSSRERKSSTDQQVVKQPEPEVKSDDNDDMTSAFEKRFGKGKSAQNKKDSTVSQKVASASAKTNLTDGASVSKTAVAAAGTAAAAGSAAVAAVFDKAAASKGKKAPHDKKNVPAQPKKEIKPASLDTSSQINTAETKVEKPVVTAPETEEEFFAGVKAETATQTTAASPAAEPAIPENNAAVEEQTPKRREYEFERDSGIIFEHAAATQPRLVPMNNAFTSVPRLDSVNAEQYHKQYDEMKSNMSKNQAYAQRFANSRTQQPFVEMPKPISKPEEPQAKAEANKTKSNTKNSSNTKNRPDKSKKKNKFPKNSKGSAKGQKKGNKSGSDKIEFYTGYEPVDDPFANPTDEKIIIKEQKASGSVGSRFKKTLGKILSTESPEDEQ